MFSENIRLALESLRANRMRALLTMLGIIIGIASVIGIVSVGNSLSGAVTEQMQNMGTNNIMVFVRERSGRASAMSSFSSLMGGATNASDYDLLNSDHIRAIRERYPEFIEEISMSESAGGGQAKSGRLYANVSVTGVNDGYRVVNNIELVSGRFITQRDLEGIKNVCVVSDTLVGNLFPYGREPLGQELRVYKSDGVEVYTIVGVYKRVESSASMFTGPSTASARDARTAVYIPVTLAKQPRPLKNYTMITVMAKQEVDPNWFTDELISFMTRYYENNPKWECSAMNMAAQIEIAGTMLANISMAIAVIAAISLLVGGIGVMNIMLVSVVERTREIGIRKALGARNTHIRMQFVTEAVIISLIGGVIGIILGLTMGAVGSYLMGSEPSFEAGIIVFTVFFSMAIGVFFGYYPANKAAKLDPIDALRYE